MLNKFFRRGLPVLFLIISASCFSQVKKDTVLISEMLSVMDSIYSRVNLNYVENVSMQKMMRKGIDAMFENLDPHTRFMSKEEAADFHFNLAAKYGGIGLVIRPIKNQIMVSSVFDGNPAQKAGIVPGDVILEVDGMNTTGKTVDDVRYKLMGDPGKPVYITIQHIGAASPQKLTIVREEINLKSVPYYGMITPGIGYIKFTTTSQNCSEEVKQALLDLKRTNQLKGLVLDIRDNMGGYAKQAIKIANFFIDKGNAIVKIKGRNEDSTQYAVEDAIDKSLPLVVLTSGSTASAAEILSGAIQDNDRGVLVGQNTYGKGLIGEIFKMGNGAEAVLTTAYYYTPSGRCIQSKNYWTSAGTAVEMADSLKRVFKTKNGRPVKEAEGIIPDIHVDGKNNNDFIQFVINNWGIFETIINYKMKHAFIPPAKDFHLTDADYEGFIAVAKEQIKNYSTQTDEKLTLLKNTAKKEGNFLSLEAEFARMETRLNDEKINALEKYKKEIKDLLEQEISYLYYHEPGRFQAGSRNDNELKKAIEILNRSELYYSILKPQ